MRFKLIAFDLDGTLINESSSWKTLHDYFGTSSVNNLKAYERGIIDYREFMRRDITSWPKKLHISKIREILSQYTLKSDAKNVIEKLKKMGYELAIVTAGVEELAKKVAKDLEIKYIIANSLETDKDGYLTGNGIFRVDLINKHEALKKLSENLGYSIKECIAVGDSKYDKKFLENAGLGIAIGTDNDLKRCAAISIQNLKELKTIIDNLMNNEEA